MVLKLIGRVLRLAVLVAVVAAAVIFGLTSGSDYLHALGKTCLVVHHGWNVHLHCGVPLPPGY